MGGRRREHWRKARGVKRGETKEGSVKRGGEKSSPRRRRGRDCLQVDYRHGGSNPEPLGWEVQYTDGDQLVCGPMF